jgi:hypothetical protein
MKSVQRNSPLPNDCDEIHSLIPAFSVGATDPEETRLVEQHLNTCAEAVAELKEYRLLTEKLLYSVPLVQAPARIGEKLMATIQETYGQPTVTSDNHLRLRPRIKGEFAAKLKQPAFLSAVLALLLLLLTNLYWNHQFTQLENHQQQMNSLVEDRDAVLALIGSGKAQRVDLLQVQDGNSEAMMLCNAKENTGFVYGENFETLASDETYQVWLVREDGTRVHGGVLLVNEQGDGTLIFQLSEPFANFERVEITRESSALSPDSLSTVVMQGSLPY